MWLVNIAFGQVVWQAIHCYTSTPHSLMKWFINPCLFTSCQILFTTHCPIQPGGYSPILTHGLLHEPHLDYFLGLVSVILRSLSKFFICRVSVLFHLLIAIADSVFIPDFLPHFWKLILPGSIILFIHLVLQNFVKLCPMVLPFILSLIQLLQLESDIEKWTD